MTLKNFDAIATMYDGSPFTYTTDGNDRKQFTWAGIIINALSANYDDERNIDATARYKRGKLIERLVAGGNVDLSVEDMADIKKCVAKGTHIQAMTQIYDMIEA